MRVAWSAFAPTLMGFFCAQALFTGESVCGIPATWYAAITGVLAILGSLGNWEGLAQAAKEEGVVR